jgi:hypothetical protein
MIRLPCRGPSISCCPHDTTGKTPSAIQKSRHLSSPSRKNISLSEIRKQPYISPRPALTGGRVAIVTNVEGGMRWTLLVREMMRTKAYGQAVWS